MKGIFKIILGGIRGAGGRQWVFEGAEPPWLPSFRGGVPLVDVDRDVLGATAGG